jgi:hypothetical protein
MTFEAIWQQLCSKKPALKTPETKIVEFTSQNLKALLRQVYEQGERHGRESAEQPAKPRDPFGGIFDGTG